MKLEQSGDRQRVLQVCFHSAQRCLTSISKGLISAKSGRRVYQEWWVSSHRWFTTMCQHSYNGLCVCIVCEFHWPTFKMFIFSESVSFSFCLVQPKAPAEVDNDSQTHLVHYLFDCLRGPSHQDGPVSLPSPGPILHRNTLQRCSKVVSGEELCLKQCAHFFHFRNRGTGTRSVWCWGVVTYCRAPLYIVPHLSCHVRPDVSLTSNTFNVISRVLSMVLFLRVSWALVRVPDQLTDILDLQGLPLPCFLSESGIVLSPFFVSRYLSCRRVVFPWRQVVLPQFWLSRRVSTSSNSGGVGFVLFLLLFLRCIVTVFLYVHSTGDFLVGYVPLLALVFLPLQSTVVVLVILTTATYPTTSHYNILGTQKRGEWMDNKESFS